MDETACRSRCFAITAASTSSKMLFNDDQRCSRFAADGAGGSPGTTRGGGAGTANDTRRSAGGLAALDDAEQDWPLAEHAARVRATLGGDGALVPCVVAVPCVETHVGASSSRMRFFFWVVSPSP